ncbi:MAG: iron chelate uptake ABC transporter family permease subunit [Gordonia sp. (in: high G+C Gram-positive bacteria)]|uniref:FecCD family ABC transporter permease n=1 Tax=Gordonia sp. (in: high G+C Gram-positive bacteria) TaxID=84139 RepID=UPI003C71D211
MIRAHRGPVQLLTLWLVGAVLLVASIAFAVTIGPSGLGFDDVLASTRAYVTGGESGLSRLQESIIWKLRLPQSVLAAVCGAGLAVCGGVLQSLLRNPLADPFVLGVSSGASVGAVSVVLLGVGAGVIGMAGGAFLGAVVAFVLVLTLARLAGGTTDRVVLAGIAGTQLFSALTSFIVYTAADAEQTRGVLFWLLGSLSSPTWIEVAVCATVTLGGLLACLFTAGALDAFMFGNDAAAAIGISVGRVRMALLAVTALITAVIVSVAGAIGFVGLVLPHAARALVGVRHRVMMPTLALLGALFLVWADVVGRVLIAPEELPIGVVTAIVGVPAFVLVLIRQGRR